MNNTIPWIPLVPSKDPIPPTPIVPNYTRLVRPNMDCRPPQVVIKPPERRCCSSVGPNELEIAALEAQVYERYAPKNNCCWMIR